VGQVVGGMEVVDAIKRGGGQDGAVIVPDRMRAVRVRDDDPVATQ